MGCLLGGAQQDSRVKTTATSGAVGGSEEHMLSAHVKIVQPTHLLPEMCQERHSWHVRICF